MEIDDIKRLVELMEEKGVVELEMDDRKGKIRLVRENHRAATAVPMASLPPPVTLISQVAVEAQPQGQAGSLVAATDTVISSPMVGTFYRASNPEAKPYIEVGSVVQKGDVVCIIEAMKMMNEIQAEVSGRVRKVLVENSQPIEYGQPLFALEPL